MTIDHLTAAQRMADLVAAVPDAVLDDATPCPDYTVAGLLDHIDGFSRAFTHAARKELEPLQERPGPGRAERLAPDWRTEIPTRLLIMAGAWAEPGAQEGMSRAGGSDMPTEVVAGIALEELVVHGWDLAQAVGLPFDVDPSDLEVARSMLEQFTAGGPSDAFGARVPVDGGSPLDEVIGLSGRDPSWTRPA